MSVAGVEVRRPVKVHGYAQTHWLRDGVVSCKTRRGLIFALLATEIEPQVTCLRCRRQIAIRDGVSDEVDETPRLEVGVGHGRGY